MSYLDIFWLLGVPALCLWPLALFLPRMPKRGGAGALGPDEAEVGGDAASCSCREHGAGAGRLHGGTEFPGPVLGVARILVRRSEGEGAAANLRCRSPRRSIPTGGPCSTTPSSPRWSAASRRENLDVRVATTRLAELRAQLGVRPARRSSRPSTPTAPTRGRRPAMSASSPPHPIRWVPTASSATPPAACAAPTWHHSASIRPASTPPGSSTCGAACSARSNPPPPRSQAAAEARRAALLSSLAEVARDYIALRGVQTQLHIARDNVHTAEQSLQLTQQRAAGGVTTDLDVANASAQLRSTMAQIPGWSSRRRRRSTR